MNQKVFSFTARIVFLLVFILHMLRLFYGWSAMIGGWEVPIWLSWLAVILAGYLAYVGLKLGRK